MKGDARHVGYSTRPLELMHQWQGQSRKWYPFTIYAIDHIPSFIRACNYIFARPRFDGTREPFYIGESGDFNKELASHKKLEPARRLGATEVHVHFLANSLLERLDAETDLRHGHWTPLNEQRTPGGLLGLGEPPGSAFGGLAFGYSAPLPASTNALRGLGAVQSPFGFGSVFGAGSMTQSVFGSGLGIPQATKRRIFVSYHHGGDQAYYNAFSQAFHDTYEVIYDNSLERKIDSEDANYVMRRIRENYIMGSSCTVVLSGSNTYERKYVDWEILATLERQHGLIGAKLPTAPVTPQNTVVAPARLHDNIESGYALWVTWEQITADAQTLSTYIEQANARAKRLLVNTRVRKFRNG
jgi:hypothetical protein